MSPRSVIRVALFAPMLVLAACQEMDPYTRPGAWQPTGANAGNMAVQVANPYDLIRGHGSANAETHAATLAVGRAWSDTTKPLPYVGSLKTSVAPAGGGSGGAAAPGGN